MHFWKALITYYHHSKFQDSVINSLWEKFNVKVLGTPTPTHRWRPTNPNAMHQYIDSPCFTSSSISIILYTNEIISPLPPVPSHNKKTGQLNDELAMNFAPWWPLTSVRSTNIMQQTRPICRLYACPASFKHSPYWLKKKKSIFQQKSQFLHELWPLMTFDLHERSLIYTFLESPRHILPLCQVSSFSD